MQDLTDLRYILLLFLFLKLLLPVDEAQAQAIDERSIMLSGRYHFGEGYAQTREQAIASARADLIEKLVVVVASENRSLLEETGEDFNQSFAAQTRSISRMQLRGLDYLPLERRDGSWRVLAYISREDYQASLNSGEQQLLQIISEGINQENRGNPGRAIGLYAQALVERQFHPLPVMVVQEPGGTEQELQIFAENKILSIIQDAVINVENLQVNSNPDEVLFEVLVTSNDRPLTGVEVGIDRRGHGFTELIDGRARVFLDTLPLQIRTSYNLLLQPIYTSSNDDFTDVATQVLPSVRKRVDVDFSTFVELDFSVLSIGTGGYQFNPEIRNLAVTEINWSLGDGTESNRLNPRHTYANPQETHIIRMQVNRIPELFLEKELRPDGRLYNVVSSEQRTITERQNRRITPPDSRRTNVRNETNRPTSRHGNTPSLPPTSSNETFGLYSVPSSHQNVINQLLRLSDFQQAQTLLSRFSRNSILIFGNRETVEDVSGSYALVIHPETRAVEAILSPEYEGNRTSLRNQQLIENVSERFSGMPVVWVKILH